MEIFPCETVNHYKAVDEILSWDSGVIYICPLCPPAGTAPLTCWLPAGGNGGSPAKVVCEHLFCEMQSCNVDKATEAMRGFSEKTG